MQTWKATPGAIISVYPPCLNNNRTLCPSYYFLLPLRFPHTNGLQEGKEQKVCKLAILLNHFQHTFYKIGIMKSPEKPGSAANVAKCWFQRGESIGFLLFCRPEGSSVTSLWTGGCLQTGKWKPCDLLSSLHQTLQASAVSSSCAVVPHGDTAISGNSLHYECYW